MVSNKLTQEVKRHAVVVAIDAKNGDGDTARFLEVARSSLHEVRKGLDVCSEVVSPVAKNETQRTVSGHQNLYSVSAELYRCEYAMWGIRTFTTNQYAMKKVQFMPAHVPGQQLLQAKELMKKLKHPEETVILIF